MKRVLVTGPVERIADWSSAAQRAGWEPIEFPLLEIARCPVDISALFGSVARFDWICVTSSNAIPFVEEALASRPELFDAALAVVGESSAGRLMEIGMAPSIEPAASAAELFEALKTQVTAETTLLWPRGNLSDALARELRSVGCTVADPIVYETRALERRVAPKCDAVFFASPSAVRAWHEGVPSSHEPRLAIAIGPTTLDALYAETDARFDRLQSLSAATPDAFAHALAHLDP
jgi:uroporphyrinogen-III synthase